LAFLCGCGFGGGVGLCWLVLAMPLRLVGGVGLLSLLLFVLVGVFEEECIIIYLDMLKFC
jgi:hypothetical protein